MSAPDRRAPSRARRRTARRCPTARLPGGPPAGGARDRSTVEQFPHGHSNLTYLIRMGDQEWVLRRPPFGNRVKTAHDMGREYRILSRLCRVYRARAGSCSLLRGRDHPRGPVLPDGAAQGGHPPRHSSARPADPARAGAAAVRDARRQHGPAARARLPRGRASTIWASPRATSSARSPAGPSATRMPAPTKSPTSSGRWPGWPPTGRPSRPAPTLIHNDFKFDNLVLDPGDLTRIVAVLDWEMATIGDPLMDLGTTLAYWTEANDPAPLHQFIVGPTTQPGSLSRRELVERYGQTTGRDTSNMLFCYVCGLFKVAVIAQQIYARYVRGLTQDPRFAGFNQVVAALGLGAVRAIDTGRI